MKKIVNGKLYDTDNATLVDCLAVGQKGDFFQYLQYLFQTDDGEWFIYIKSRSSGEDIRPLKAD